MLARYLKDYPHKIARDFMTLIMEKPINYQKIYNYIVKHLGGGGLKHITVLKI